MPEEELPSKSKVSAVVKRFENSESAAEINLRDDFVEFFKSLDEKTGTVKPDICYELAIQFIVNTQAFMPVYDEQSVLNELKNPSSQISIRMQSFIQEEIMIQFELYQRAEKIFGEHAIEARFHEVEEYLKQCEQEYEDAVKKHKEGEDAIRTERRATRKRFQDSARFLENLTEQQTQALTAYIASHDTLDSLYRESDLLNSKIKSRASHVDMHFKQLEKEFKRIVDEKFEKQLEKYLASDHELINKYRENRHDFSEKTQVFSKSLQKLLDDVNRESAELNFTDKDMLALKQAHTEMNKHFQKHLDIMNAIKQQVKKDKQKLFEKEIQSDLLAYKKVNTVLAFRLDRLENRMGMRAELKKKIEEAEAECKSLHAKCQDCFPESERNAEEFLGHVQNFLNETKAEKRDKTQLLSEKHKEAREEADAKEFSADQQGLLSTRPSNESG